MKSNFLTRFLVISLIAFLFSHYSILTHAHEGHAHPLEKEEIIVKANKVIDLAIEQQKLEPSWKDAKMVEEKILETKGGQWLIQYKNPKIVGKDSDLFIFLTLDGKYIAMNHTGK
ncbi:MAG: DUF6488 family protein [Gammaproteobacteria bacterium]